MLKASPPTHSLLKFCKMPGASSSAWILPGGNGRGDAFPFLPHPTVQLWRLEGSGTSMVPFVGGPGGLRAPATAPGEEPRRPVWGSLVGQWEKLRPANMAIRASAMSLNSWTGRSWETLTRAPTMCQAWCRVLGIRREMECSPAVLCVSLSSQRRNVESR